LEIFENNFTVGVFSISADPNITDLLQREHTKILAGIGEGYQKAAFGIPKFWTKVTTEVQVIYALSIGAKISDLG